MKKGTILIILLFNGFGVPPYDDLQMPGKVYNDFISEVGFLPYFFPVGRIPFSAHTAIKKLLLFSRRS